MGVFSRKAVRDDDNNFVASSYREPRPLTAAAVRVDLSEKRQIDALRNRRSTDTWQEDAWEYFDLIGEVKYAATLIAAVTSRVRLYPGYVSDDTLAPQNLKSISTVDDDVKRAAAQALRLLETGNGGIPGLLQDAALNLFVTGECYLVQQPAKVGSNMPETWQIRSVDEITVSGAGKSAKTFLQTRRSARKEDLVEVPQHAVLGRIWRMHPRYSDEADSSVRGLLELMDELLLLNKSARKTLKSRLPAGILFIPDDFSNIAQADGDVDESTDSYAEDSDDNSDSFEEELIHGLTAPLSDENSVSTIAPTFVRGPADLGDKIRHITFDQALDPHLSERADKVLGRILAGLDIPKDIVAGIGDAKYANAVAIEESLYKSHIEPLVLLIVDALTVIFLRPVLRAMGFEEEVVSQIVIWYDPSAITTKPSKADAANTGYENRILSAEAWRRSNGFSESDAPSSIEVGQRIAAERGLLSEPVTEALFKLLIPEIMEQVRTEAMQQSPSADSLEAVIDNNGPEEAEVSPEPPTELLEP